MKIFVFPTFSRISCFTLQQFEIVPLVRLIQCWEKEYVLKISFRKIDNINLKLF